MRRLILTAGAALLVAVPAALGLVGNTSFAQSVPVRIPAQATLVDDTGSEHPGEPAEKGDDKGGQRPAGSTEPGDDKGGPHPARTTGTVDDKGGQRATSNAVPGNTGSGPGDSGSGKGKNGGQGGSGSRTSSRDNGSGHT